MILLKPVQPNFIKILAIATIGTFSLNAFAEHHGSAEEKASKAAKTSEQLEATNLIEETQQDLSADELKMKMDDEKAKAEMKKMMAKDSKQKPEIK